MIYFLSLFISCKESENSADNIYVTEIKKWQEKRVSDLKAEDGWLNLVGLFEVQEGENTFGADASNGIVFPAGKAPGKIGFFLLNEGVVSVNIAPGIQVMADSNIVQKMRLMTDKDDKPTTLKLGSLRWYVIQRGENFYVRLRDLESELLKDFKGIASYPIASSWRIPAILQKYDSLKTVPIPNVLGEMIDWHSPGALFFEINGETYKLDALGKLSDERLFVIFTDETSRDETYPAGRFMYVETPGKDGKTFIDFNKAYNPPCAFTPYATCPLPPEQNHLPLRVTAGEKNYDGSGH
ncbi:MAG: DUF1684 domain-containing protein [bacterium]